MPARSTQLHVVKRDAAKAGLAFAMPRWWDVASIFEENASRRITLPDGREVLLLDWTSLLAFDVKTGKKTWDLPALEAKERETQEQQETLLERVQEAEWFVIEREQVWLVPERPRPGCEVLQEPPWWSTAPSDPDFRRWYRTFQKRHRLQERRFELPNPIWVDYVSLLTGPEALSLDERARKAYRRWKRSIGQQRLTAHIRKEMARFARALQQAEWVVVYDYEWESGLA